MNNIEKIDFALSFFIGTENVDDILELDTEEEIENYLVNREFDKVMKQ